MSAAADLSALSVAAAQAASAGDTAGAIDLLRQLLALQSQHLGADHADRATTLNNLALLLERQGSVDEAGACYREAYEIARRALGPDDPMVQISRANLVAFLDGQGITAHDDLLGPAAGLHDFDAEAGAPAPATTATPPPSASSASVTLPEHVAAANPEPAADLPLQEPTPVVRAAPRVAAPAPAPADKRKPAAPAAKPTAAASRSKAPRSTARTPSSATAPTSGGSRPPIAWIAAGVILIGIAAWMFANARSSTPPDAAGNAVASTPAAESAVPPPASVPPPTPAPAVTPSDSTGATPPASTSEPQRSEPEAPAVTADRAAPPREESERNTLAPEDVAATTVPLVTEARVCEQLRTGGAVWRCDPVTADSDVASYYTRIRSARRLTVQHVWLRDGREVHRASLRVDANAREGYRTYSRQRLTPGSWQVRVMDAGGNVLEEDAFEVR